MHFATTGQTAAGIIYTRANSEQPFMGLTTWKNSPKGKILKSDVLVAKNYLNQSEVSKLNLLVTMFIDFAELRAFKAANNDNERLAETNRKISQF